MIIVVDYGMGNVGSVFNMLRKLGAKVRVSRDSSEIVKADKFILPGVGHFDQGMTNFHETGLIPIMTEQVLELKKPILGICLGMQMMTKSSQEGSLPGLGWVDAETLRFSSLQELKIPHMGWNTVYPCNKSTLFDHTPKEPERFYFAHSYFVYSDNPVDMAASCFYGHDFVAAFEVENVFGVQFHPEKSHLFGMSLFQKFMAL